MSNSISASGVDSTCGLEFEPLDEQPTVPDRMDEIFRLAMRYQVIVDWCEELGFVATCTEIRTVVARASDVDWCVNRLFVSIASHIAGLRSEQRPLPMPRPWSGRKSGMRMVSDDAVASSSGSSLSSDDGDPVIAPPSDQLLRMAEWTAHQYRMLVSISEGSYTAISPEIPNMSGSGSSASECAADLRVKLVMRVAEMIESNQMPPEPIQEIERQAASRGVSQNRRSNFVIPLAA